MKLNRLLCAFLAAIMVGANLGGLIPVKAADGDDPTVDNPAPYHVPDGDEDESNDLILYKTAESVPGYANRWKVTLKIEAPQVTVTSDTVLIMDSSWSMRGDPLVEAKSAAETLVEELLPESNKQTKINRVAVIPYDATTHSGIGFSYDGEAVSEAIQDISIGSNYGTATQGALRAAVNLLASSEATYKSIILLSDGEPNYSCSIDEPDDYLTDGGPGSHTREVQTSTNVPKSAFDCSTRVGAGSSMWTQYATTAGGGGRVYHYYNHGNSAIAEAGFFNGQGHLYTIYFQTSADDEHGEQVLEDMAEAAGGEAHRATADELEEIFQNIAGKISDLVSSAHVHDVMGEGVVVEDAEHSTEIDWNNINFEYKENIGKFVASYSYEVEAGEHILDAESTDGFHPLNEDATLIYVDADGNQHEEPFPVPRVKPFFINVKKEIEGQECATDECVFNFKIEHPAGEKTTEYTVEAGKTHRIIEAFPIGNYTLTETGTNSDNPVKFENYLVSYTGNTFAINEQHADHIDVTIKNTYETVDLSASKVWDDENNQDGLRKNYEDFWVVVKDGDGNYVAMQALTESNQDYSFEDLPKNYNGSEITYKVVEATGCEEDSEGAITCEEEFDGNNGEISIDDDYTTEVGEGNVVTNKHIPATVKIVVNKNWDDDNNRDGLRTDNKQVEFCVIGKVDGEVVYEKTCKQASSLIDEIEIEFTNLPKNHNGDEIEYLVEESEFFGYNVTGLPEEAFIVEDEENLNATNKHTPERVSLLIQKVWDDEDDKDGIRPTKITVNVTGGEEDISLTITEEDFVDGKCESWCAEVAELYKYRNGSEIEYSVDEEEVADYETKITGSVENGFTITNTHTSEPEPEPEPEPDPCADGGCGGEDITPITPITPETGRITLQKRSNAESSWINNFICITIVTLVSTGIFAFKKYKEKQLTK